MTSNSRKGLEFSYNLANLPESVEGADGASLTYSYLSDGSKWRASANTGPSILYRGSFVYEDDGNSSRISSIAWDEGRISYHYAPEAVDSLVVDSGEGVVDSLEVVGVVDSLVVEDGICDEWHVRDLLGSVRAIAGIGNYITGIRELNSNLPFGTRIPGSIQAADNRHRFSGKEEQRYGSFSLGLSDFGARYYDPFTCRWTTRDPMAGKYLSLSPYNYCAGNPVNLLDLNGMDVYILLYTTDNSRGDEMFKASAETRKRDIENSSSFDSKNDIVIIVGIQDMAAISSTVSSIVEAYSGDYGKTKEFSVWSHGGKDGPVGSIATSDFSLDTKQMTLEGWSNIDFNWGKNSTANFFGCNTGNGSPSFTTNVSNLENFENVTVNGQQSSSYPSIFTDTRTNNSSIINGSFSYPTYMVGSKRGGIIGHFFPSSTPAVPMSSSLNGIEMNKKYYQNGRKH